MGVHARPSMVRTKGSLTGDANQHHVTTGRASGDCSCETSVPTVPGKPITVTHHGPRSAPAPGITLGCRQQAVALEPGRSACAQAECPAGRGVPAGDAQSGDQGPLPGVGAVAGIDPASGLGPSELVPRSRRESLPPAPEVLGPPWN